jgi:hypothetical protein
VDRDAPLEEFERIAPEIPVFRVTPAAPAAAGDPDQDTTASR